MKQVFISSIIIFLFTISGNAQSKSIENSAYMNTIEVIDFHTTRRCVTCKAIEANTKYTLEKYFARDMKDGKLTFQVVNVEDKENEKLAEKFEASGTALFLNVRKDGTEKHIDLTNFAFMYGKDKVNFSTKLRRTIKEELSNL